MTEPHSPTLSRVLSGDLCTGCGLCAGLSGGAVNMTVEAPGFARPRQIAPLDKRTEQAIATACPGTTISSWPDAPYVHEYWGPWIKTVTAHATDQRVRFAGSSGGMVTALAIHALETGMVSRVLHIEADPDHPTRNVLTWSETADALIAGAGSRYASSSPLADIDTALAAEGRFLFIGKPCDVSALRQLAKSDPRVDQKVPLMLSFFCAGVPSHAGADAVILDMGLDPTAVTRFRYRGNGWPGLTVAETADGARGEMRYADSWGRHLSPRVQARCKICPDGVGGVADLACADAWYGGETGYPQFEEQEGRSLTMARTPAGAALLAAAEQAGRVVSSPLEVDQIDLMQPGQVRRKRALRARIAGLRLIGKPVPVMQGLYVTQAGRRAPRRESFRNFVGIIRRRIRR